SGRYVLTLFEEHTAEELPYFLDLMAYLAERGVPCPRPVENVAGKHLGELNGKPAALVSCLRGRDLETPSAAHCAEVGRVLAEMHIAGQAFPSLMQNPRGAQWRKDTAAKVHEFLGAADQALLSQALALDASLNLDALPRGVIHADLFRDNVLFDGDRLGGLIDFYYACNDALLYDIAIAVNDWCVSEEGVVDDARMQALLKAYHAVRPLTDAEHVAWPAVLQVAALRFWVSRLLDKHFPHAGELTHAKDPQHFQKVLHTRIEQQHKAMAF
ncbi:MAG: homoserine kinase, partial [Methylophilaceae bacterium]